MSLKTGEGDVEGGEPRQQVDGCTDGREWSGTRTFSLES